MLWLTASSSVKVVSKGNSYMTHSLVSQSPSQPVSLANVLLNKFILHNRNKTRNLWRFDLFQRPSSSFRGLHQNKLVLNSSGSCIFLLKLAKCRFFSFANSTGFHLQSNLSSYNNKYEKAAAKIWCKQQCITSEKTHLYATISTSNPLLMKDM